jgi:hypothetical protein
MSKEEAWKEIESAFNTVCQQMCGFECSCEETLKQVKEVLYV